jgi:hypothetical protein
MNWWYETVKIRSIKGISLPKNPFKEVTNSETLNSDESNNINKKYIIILGVVILIGLGVLYYFYSDLSGSSKGGSAPSTSSTADTHQITITDNKTPPPPIETNNSLRFNQRTFIIVRSSRMNQSSSIQFNRIILSLVISNSYRIRFYNSCRSGVATSTT